MAEAGAYVACSSYLSVLRLLLAFYGVFEPAKFESGLVAYTASQIRTRC